MDIQERLRRLKIELADIDRRLTIQEQKRRLGDAKRGYNYFRDLAEADEEPQYRVVVTPNGEVYRL